ncbi:MAG: hypothetical protein ACKOW3_01725 [Hyphomicrobium sp.]
MIRLALACITILTFVINAKADEKCKNEVDAAYVKQRQTPAFRTVATLETANGPLVRTIDFVAPDSIYVKIVAPTEDAPVETIGIGKWAWANTEGGWEEQPPHNAQMVTSDREAYKIPPKAASDFTCLQKVQYKGRELLGYATPPTKESDGKEVVTTVYVDPTTGLPEAYVTKSVQAEDPPKFIALYSYGKDIVIVAPGQMEDDSSKSSGDTK